ncbi:GNAT family protein [Altererythrobacter aquiaggeris]|uniref:GNAT family N-acetyltransferase n=1 Tax=Aestuarierythrobacter aquiaggeris TaxID=1898396 RepID=UPI003015B9D7
MSDLGALLEAYPVRLEPLADHHTEPLRAACAEDRDIWEIYPVNMLDDGFDLSMGRFHQLTSWVRFAVIDLAQDRLVGMTNYIDPVAWPDGGGAVEIGGTFIVPSVRASGFNRIMKKLMIEHAFANGFTRIQFNIDTRNKRSMAAVAKLGATLEGTLRRNRKTWNGYVRDTAQFGLLEDEWAG